LRPKRAGAILSTELLLVLPILTAILFAFVEFSMLWAGNQQVVAAARAGCRVASMQGATVEEVERVVHLTLGRPRYVAASQVEVLLGKHTGDPVAVEVRLPMAAVAPDLLALLGFRLGDRELVADMVMRKE